MLHYYQNPPKHTVLKISVSNLLRIHMNISLRYMHLPIGDPFSVPFLVYRGTVPTSKKSNSNILRQTYRQTDEYEDPQQSVGKNIDHCCL